MKVVVAIDSFKGSISSLEGSKAIASGINKVYPDAEIVCVPLADGGEGTTEALISATNGELRNVEVTGPLGTPVKSIYGILGNRKTAVIEVAAACGLPLVPVEYRNPLKTTTFGVGEMILDALRQGCREFVIGLGGTATNDAGIGMLQALGFSFKDAEGHEVSQGGGSLSLIRSIDTNRACQELDQCVFRVACDVHNPLFGPDGAAYVFAPQKGADPVMVKELDEGLASFAEVVHNELNVDVGQIPGAGAAGGLGAAFAFFLSGTLQPGIELVLDIIGMEQKLADADFVITGEGRLDGQTSMGKAPLGIARLSQKYGIPVLAYAGGITKEASVLNGNGITSYFPIVSGPMSLELAMDPKETKQNLRRTAEQVFRIIRAVKGMS
ncbi:glycerate kinase [Paenibacillus sp. yr247]|uniref:glycerate kinase family protein n=1 Tax=Paenibacillus sp. yr247 TaxID=1761880 RepID=UPI00088A539D|nr:glycerate kinase [Paenibacillus sp. yr247]SDO23384.1 glycerate kinase [Paenibacillus sp. yr247]